MQRTKRVLALSAAIDRLADHIENGHLLASDGIGTDFLNAVANHIELLEKVAEAARPLSFGQGWGVRLALMPADVAKTIVRLRVPLQDALADLDQKAETNATA